MRPGHSEPLKCSAVMTKEETKIFMKMVVNMASQRPEQLEASTTSIEHHLDLCKLRLKDALNITSKLSDPCLKSNSKDAVKERKDRYAPVQGKICELMAMLKSLLNATKYHRPRNSPKKRKFSEEDDAGTRAAELDQGNNIAQEVRSDLSHDEDSDKEDDVPLSHRVQGMHRGATGPQASKVDHIFSTTVEEFQMTLDDPLDDNIEPKYQPTVPSSYLEVIEIDSEDEDTNDAGTPTAELDKGNNIAQVTCKSEHTELDACNEEVWSNPSQHTSSDEDSDEEDQVPISPYNKFMFSEIAKLKAQNTELTHKECFKKAFENWTNAS